MTQAERQAKNRVDAAIEQLGAAVEEIMASHKPATLDEAKEAERRMIDAMYSAVLGATPAEKERLRRDAARLDSLERQSGCGRA